VRINHSSQKRSLSNSSQLLAMTALRISREFAKKKTLKTPPTSACAVGGNSCAPRVNNMHVETKMVTGRLSQSRLQQRLFCLLKLHLRPSASFGDKFPILASDKDFSVYSCSPVTVCHVSTPSIPAISTGISMWATVELLSPPSIDGGLLTSHCFTLTGLEARTCGCWMWSRGKCIPCYWSTPDMARWVASSGHIADSHSRSHRVPIDGFTWSISRDG